MISVLLILAIAANTSDAEKLIKKGVELRKQRKDAAALDLFREAHAIDPTPRALAQIALAEQALGLWLDAEEHLRTALAATSDPWIRSNAKPLKNALAEINSHISRISIGGAPEGASVRIAGGPPRIAPLAEPVRVSCSTAITVEISAAGFLPYSRSITPACGKDAIVEITLEKEPEKPKEPEPLPQAPVVVAPVERSEPVSLAPFAYIAGGAAILSLGTGVAMLVVREGHAKKYNDDSMCLLANGMTRDQNCGSVRRSAENAQLWSIVGFAAGGAFGVAAGALFLLDEPAPEPRLSCGPFAGGAGLACAGVFE
jgi:tetratricopeptide (TPR) repeat protein